LHKETDHTVVSQIFKALSTTAVMLSSKHEVVQKVLKAAIKRAEDSHPDVRCSSLQLIGRLCPKEPIKLSGGRTVDLMDMLTEFTADQDPRVRAAVYQTLLVLHQKRHVLGIDIYTKAVAALEDDYEGVRLAAIKLIWVFSHMMPEKMIQHPHDENDEIRLLDDGFIKICNMANDGCMNVRAQAVGLLGSLHDVSFHILMQTLDKKVMSMGRKTKSMNERQLEKFRGGQLEGGSWSSGNTWGDKAPHANDNKNMEDVQLMNIGACGVFVRGMEDEFMEVRGAAVDSICELANQNSQFARLSTDFLVDMINDEIEAIRLNSITSLIKTHEYVDLREDQLDTILNVLNDFNWDIRLSLRTLLAHCELSTQACLHATVLALLANLKKYPHDRESIWNCMKDLGRSHPYFVSSLVPQLLLSHSYYDVPQPNIDDTEYISIAILVFNAAQKCPSMHSLLPPYLKQHYNYLRDSLPIHVPDLSATISQDEKSKDSQYDAVNSFYNFTVKRISVLKTMGADESVPVLKSIISDLNHIKCLHPAFKPVSEFLSIFLQCYKLLMQARRDRAWSVPAALATDECGPLHNVVEEIIKQSYRMEFTFSGLSSSDVNAVKLLRVLAHCLQLLLKLRYTTKMQGSRRVNIDMWDPLLQRLQKFRSYMTSTSSVTDQLGKVIELQDAVELNISSVATLFGLIQEFFLSYSFDPLQIENRLRQSMARINEPKGNSDNPLRFCAGLVLSVDVDATLENVDDVSNIYIKVMYPDKTVQFHKPKTSDFRCLSKDKYHLVSSVLLSHQVWTEPCQVGLSVALAHQSDLKEEITFNNLTTGKSDDSSSYCDLSEVVNVVIQPKAISK